jgi:predicted RND superfamily exporter protein
MALPVLYAAMELAKRNLEELPEVVGFDIQSTGEFAQMVSRDTAVYGPFALTVLCVVLMLMSRKTIYPWLISIFTLVLPLLIWVLNAGLF